MLFYLAEKEGFYPFVTSKNPSPSVVGSVFFVLRQLLSASLHLPPAAVGVAPLAAARLQIPLR
jgi:hypothetical protein